MSDADVPPANAAFGANSTITVTTARPEGDAATLPGMAAGARERLACLQTLCVALASAPTAQQVEEIVNRAGVRGAANAPDGARSPDMKADTDAFVQAVMQMRAQALERITLAHALAAEQQARGAAEREWEQAALAQSVTARLSQAVTLAEVGAVIVDAGAEILGAHRGVLALLMSGRDRLEVARALGYDSRIAQTWQQFPLDAPIPLADSAREGRAIWIRNLGERNARYPQLARIQTSSHAYAVVPLAAHSRVLGAVSFGFDHARDFDDHARAFILTLAEQGAFALDRARLHDAAGRALAYAHTRNDRLRHSMAETNHRVKNNLQVISALVDLQLDAAQTTVSADAMRRVGVHARALATLHDLLADQKTALEINTISARALIGKMIPLLQVATGGHKMLAHIDDVRLPVRVGASLCLLINELVSNAIKHGGRQVRLSLTGQNEASTPAPAAPAPAGLSDYYAEISELLAITQAEAAQRKQAGVAGSEPLGEKTGQEETGQGETAAKTADAANTAGRATAGGAAGGGQDSAFFTTPTPAAPARDICLRVSDDGPGFAPGFDVALSAHTGLDLVVNISRLDMNGSVTFANAPEGGAQVSITFTLPED